MLRLKLNQLDTSEQPVMTFEAKSYDLHFRNAFENVICIMSVILL